MVGWEVRATEERTIMASDVATKIGLVQFNANFSGQSYLPLSVGSLWANYENNGKHFTSYDLKKILYKRESITKTISTLEGISIIAISLYVWNEQLSLELARELKKKNPQIIIIAGGPQIPDNAENWLRENPCIDFAAHGEGEFVFADLLDTLVEVKFDLLDTRLLQISGISFIQKILGVTPFISTPPRARNRELELKSPFLNGFFDMVIAEYPDEKWMALWETNRGCPFSCTFCDWGSATNAKVSQFAIERISSELRWIAEQKIEFVFVCDANFGILPRDLDIARDIVDVNNRTGFPRRVSTQSTKNVTNRAFEVQCTLSNAGVANGATLSMQSLSKITLEAIKRQNISLEKYFELQSRYKLANVPTYVDLILGLPEETLKSFKEGVSTLLDLGQHDHIQFNNLSLLPNSEMNSQSHHKLYEYEIVNTAVQSLHGSSVPDASMPVEMQSLVVGTKTMKDQDWIEARAYAWMTSFIHLDKIAQLPILLCKALTNLEYYQIITTLMDSNLEHLSYLSNFFRSTAKNLQITGEEYVSNKEYLDINWTADEYAFIHFVATGNLKQLIDEVISELQQISTSANTDINPEIILSGFRDVSSVSNNWLILPRIQTDYIESLQTNAIEVCNEIISGNRIQLLQALRNFEIDRTSEKDFLNMDFLEWCRKIVWYRNKRGAYNYDVFSKVGPPEGHYR